MYTNFFVTRRSWNSSLSASAIDPSIPAHISQKIDSLSKQFFPTDVHFPKVTIQPLMYLDRHRKYNKEKYYASIISYGSGSNKTRFGIFHLLDSEGKILYTQNEDVPNDEILGITDVDSDGTHELVISWGSWIGGGIKIVTLTGNQKIKICEELSLPTRFD